jgi:DNA-binding NarL/FixJ family response regulator
LSAAARTFPDLMPWEFPTKSHFSDGFFDFRRFSSYPSQCKAIVCRTTSDSSAVAFAQGIHGRAEHSPVAIQIRQECSQVHVLIFTAQANPSYIRTALAAGATGYVVKTATETELLTAIRAVHLGRTFVAAQLSSNQLHAILGNRRRRDRAAPDKGTYALSGRELEVLKLLAVGHTNQEIGERLHLSVKTIETYRLRISEKLGLRGRANLTRYAADIGLIEFTRAGAD